MKRIKYATFMMGLLACLFFILPVSADAQTNGNVAAVCDVDITEIGESLTIQITTQSMTVSSFTCGLAFNPALVQVVSVTESPIMTSEQEPWEAIAVSTTEQANGAGTVGFAYANSGDRVYEASTIAEITFEAIGQGRAVFAIYEDSDGTDGNRSDSVQTLTCEIGDSFGVSDYSVRLSGTTATSASVTMVNQTEAEAEGFFVVAAYDAEGRMITHQQAEGPFAPELETSVTVSWKTSDTVTEIRAFVLDKSHAPLRSRWQTDLK